MYGATKVGGTDLSTRQRLQGHALDPALVARHGLGHATEVGGVAIAVDASGGADDHVAVSVQRRSHGGGLLVHLRPRQRSEEGHVVGEDAAVAGHQPVAAAIAARSHADDGLIELGPTSRTEETGGAEG